MRMGTGGLARLLLCCAAGSFGCEPAAGSGGPGDSPSDARPEEVGTTDASVGRPDGRPQPDAATAHDGAAPVDGAPPDSAALADGILPDGRLPDGRAPDGPLPDGQAPDGAPPDGSLPDGRAPDGPLVDGPLPDGPLPDGRAPDGPPDAALPDGPLLDGPLLDGAAPDGPPPDAAAPDGPPFDAAAPDGPPLDAAAPDGPLPDAPVPDVAPESCGDTPHGGGEARGCFAAAQVPHGQECVADEQVRVCDDGRWAPDYPDFAHLACEVLPPDHCGETPHGGTESRRCYHAGAVAAAEDCTFDEQSRTCQDGAWAPDFPACDHLACAVAVCGDGVRTPGELCDDGNRSPFDACVPHTTYEDEVVGVAGAGNRIAIEIDPEGAPRVCFRDGARRAVCATPGADGWTADVVAAAAAPARLLFDADGAPHVLLYGEYGDLLYARRVDGVWAVERLADRGRGDHVSAAWGPGGALHAVWYNSVTDVVVHAVWEADGWVEEEVARAVSECRSTGLAFDGDGRPHVVHGPQGGLNYAVRGDQGWVTERVDAAAGAGFSSALALDGGGAPHVAYAISGGELRHARRDVNGWEVTTVDAEGSAGSYLDLALDPVENAVIAYQAGQPDDLRVAYGEDGRWDRRDVRVDGAVGFEVALALDAVGRPLVAHRDSSQDRVVLTTAHDECAEAACGDGYHYVAEEACDDGNDDDHDGCTRECVSVVCGDGVVAEGIEGCDDGDHDLSDDCPDGPDGTCEPARCGDGLVRSDVEDCDDGDRIDTNLCTNQCVWPAFEVLVAGNYSIGGFTKATRWTLHDRVTENPFYSLRADGRGGIIRELCATAGELYGSGVCGAGCGPAYASYFRAGSGGMTALPGEDTWSLGSDCRDGAFFVGGQAAGQAVVWDNSVADQFVARVVDEACPAGRVLDVLLDGDRQFVVGELTGEGACQGHAYWIDGVRHVVPDEPAARSIGRLALDGDDLYLFGRLQDLTLAYWVDRGADGGPLEVHTFPNAVSTGDAVVVDGVVHLLGHRRVYTTLDGVTLQSRAVPSYKTLGLAVRGETLFIAGSVGVENDQRPMLWIFTGAERQALELPRQGNFSAWATDVILRGR